MHTPTSTYRSPETQARYEAYLREVPDDGACVLCPKASKREFTHWRIVENSFPYDRIASVHDLLLPKAHKSVNELGAEEWREFEELKHGQIDQTYQYILEPTSAYKTQPAHFHIHLLVGN